MSRYTIPSNDENVIVTIGWDAPLQTFFAQVMQVNPDIADEDEEPEMIVWEGTKPGQHNHLGFILPKLEPYCEVPKDLLKQLAQDQATSTTPSPLQLHMQQKFSGHADPELHVLEEIADSIYDLSDDEFLAEMKEDGNGDETALPG